MAGPVQLSWQNVVGTLAFAMVVAGAGWTLFQNQFSAMTGIINDNKAVTDRMFAGVRRDLEARDTELRNELHFVRDILIQLRREMVGQPEFNQYSRGLSDRLDRIDRQLHVLESTRPTTGELQATGRSLSEHINRLEERLRQVEAFIRGDPRPRQPEVPKP